LHAQCCIERLAQSLTCCQPCILCNSVRSYPPEKSEGGSELVRLLLIQAGVAQFAGEVICAGAAYTAFTSCNASLLCYMLVACQLQSCQARLFVHHFWFNNMCLAAQASIARCQFFWCCRLCLSLCKMPRVVFYALCPWTLTHKPYQTLSFTPTSCSRTIPVVRFLRTVAPSWKRLWQ